MRMHPAGSSFFSMSITFAQLAHSLTYLVALQHQIPPTLPKRRRLARVYVPASPCLHLCDIKSEMTSACLPLAYTQSRSSILARIPPSEVRQCLGWRGRMPVVG